MDPTELVMPPDEHASRTLETTVQSKKLRIIHSETKEDALYILEKNVLTNTVHSVSPPFGGIRSRVTIRNDINQ